MYPLMSLSVNASEVDTASLAGDGSHGNDDDTSSSSSEAVVANPPTSQVSDEHSIVEHASEATQDAFQAHHLGFVHPLKSLRFVSDNPVKTTHERCGPFSLVALSHEAHTVSVLKDFLSLKHPLTRGERTLLGHHIERKTRSATTYNKDSQYLLQRKVP